MIEKIYDISIWWKLLFLALLMAAVAAVTFHYTSKHYVAKVATLEEVIKNRDGALVTAGESITELITAVETQNKAFKEISEARLKEQEVAKDRLLAVEKTGRLLYIEIASLKEKVKRPNVNVAGMTTVEIATEIGECRRAVEINNVAETGELI